MSQERQDEIQDETDIMPETFQESKDIDNDDKMKPWNRVAPNKLCVSSITYTGKDLIISGTDTKNKRITYIVPHDKRGDQLIDLQNQMQKLKENDEDGMNDQIRELSKTYWSVKQQVLSEKNVYKMGVDEGEGYSMMVTRSSFGINMKVGDISRNCKDEYDRYVLLY